MTAASPDMLRRLNKDLEEMVPGKTGKDWNYFYALFENTSGHFPGNYMSATMVRNGYRKKMLDHCDNPFAFIRIYNKAAQKDSTKPPVFSQKAMRTIAALEKNIKSKSYSLQDFLLLAAFTSSQLIIFRLLRF